MRNLVYVVLFTLAACGNAAPTDVPTPAPAVVTEPALPGATVTARAANLRLQLLRMAAEAEYDVAKFVAAADEFLGKRQAGIAKLQGELKQRNARLAELAESEAKEAIFADGGKDLEDAFQLQLVIALDHDAFLKKPEVAERMGRVGL